MHVEQHLAQGSVCEPTCCHIQRELKHPFVDCRLLDFDVHDKQGTQQPLDSTDLTARPLFFTGDCRLSVCRQVLLPVQCRLSHHIAT